MHVKRTQNTYRGRVGVYPGVSGSHSKRPRLQVSSGFRATVLKCAFEASLVSIPEMYYNNNSKENNTMGTIEGNNRRKQ